MIRSKIFIGGNKNLKKIFLRGKDEKHINKRIRLMMTPVMAYLEIRIKKIRMLLIMMMIKRMTSNNNNNSIITRLYMILWMTKIYILLFRIQRIHCKILRYEINID